MSVTQWALTKGTIAVIKDAETDGKVGAAAEAADKLVTGFFPEAAAEVKTLIVRHILFPFARAFLKGDPGAFDREKARP